MTLSNLILKVVVDCLREVALIDRVLIFRFALTIIRRSVFCSKINVKFSYFESNSSKLNDIALRDVCDVVRKQIVLIILAKSNDFPSHSKVIFI